jgi:hypothetical protein
MVFLLFLPHFLGHPKARAAAPKASGCIPGETGDVSGGTGKAEAAKPPGRRNSPEVVARNEWQKKALL